MGDKMHRQFQTTFSNLSQEAINLIAFLTICVVALGISAFNNWTMTPLRLLTIISSLGLALTLGMTLIQQNAFLNEPQALLFIALAVAFAVVATFTGSALIVWLLFAFQCFVAWLLLWFSISFENVVLF